jgi:hypothetical protein
VVIMSSEEYYRLKRRDRQVLALSDFTESDMKTLMSMQPPAEAAQFDHEVQG